jgi:hypothetical protein
MGDHWLASSPFVYMNKEHTFKGLTLLKKLSNYISIALLSIDIFFGSS